MSEEKLCLDKSEIKIIGFWSGFPLDYTTEDVALIEKISSFLKGEQE